MGAAGSMLLGSWSWANCGPALIFLAMGVPWLEHFHSRSSGVDCGILLVSRQQLGA
jgi:hypothetical protein